MVAAANERSVASLRENGATAIDDGLVAHLATMRLGLVQDGSVERLVNAALPGGRPDTLSLAGWIARERGIPLVAGGVARDD